MSKSEQARRNKAPRLTKKRKAKPNNRRKLRRQVNQLQIERLEPRQLLSADFGWASSFDLGNWSVESSSSQFLQIHSTKQASHEFFWEPVQTNDGALVNLPNNIPLGENGGSSEASPSSPSFIPINENPARNSNPGAPITLYLDFDGHFEPTWGGYNNATTPVYDIDGDATTFSDTELARMQTAWEAVSEDFAPFDVNVTTVEPAILADGNTSNDNGVALRVAIGGSWEDWRGSPAGGVAYVNSFTSSIPNVVYVFSDNASSLFGETASHEAGHGFGLYHQSTYDAGGTMIDEYNPGNSQWQPIMGGGSSSLSITSTWYNGTNSNGSNSYQDDLAVLNNAIGYRGDDHSNVTAGATPLSGNAGSGIIETHNDVDMFSFTITGLEDTYRIRVDGAEIEQNLDAVLELRNSSGGLVASANPNDTLDAEIVEALTAGDYFVAVSKSSVYGYLGQYTVNIDSLPAGVSVSSASEILTTSEGGLAASFDVALDTKPTADVMIDVISSDPRQAVLSDSILTFTPSNWNVPQTVTITSVDDNIVELPSAYEVLFGSVSSSDSEYDSFVIPDVISLVNIDNDTPGWAFALTGQDNVYSTDIRIGPDGNIYLTGYFYGSADFDPGSGTEILTSQDSERSDGYIAKYTPAGDLIWAQSFGGAEGYDIPREIAFDDTGNVYLAGYSSSDAATFGPYSLTNQGSNDAFLAKLDENGNFLWARSWGNENSDKAYGISVADNGTIHLIGRFQGTVDFDPGNGAAETFNLTSDTDSYDVYLLNLDSSGNFISALAIGGAASDYGYRVVAGDAGDVYLTGYFRETASFGSNNGTPVVLTSGGEGSIDSFLMKASLSGSTINTEWVRSATGTESVSESRIAMDGAGNVYFTGYFNGTIDFGTGNPTLVSAGNRDSFITKWDTQGNLVWSGQISGVESNRVFDLSVDSDGGAYFVGNFGGTTDFNFGSESAQLTSLGTRNSFVLKLGLDSSIQYLSQIFDDGYPSHRSIARDDAGNVYLGTTFRETVGLPMGDVLSVHDEAQFGAYVAKLIMAPGITVSPSAGLATSEAGGTANFSVVLDMAPTADVTVALSSSDPSEGTVSQTSLTFTPSNWSVPQAVTINGVNDSVIDGDVDYTIITSSVTSNDSGYDGLNPADVSVVNVDDDQPLILFEDSFEVSEWNGLWTEDSQNDWRRQTQRATDGNWSAEVDGRATNATLTTASSIDLSNMQSATLTFDWLIESGYDNNEFLSLDISTDGGSNWQTDVRRLSGNVDFENSWHTETVELSGYQTNDLKFRFRSTVSRSSEDANVDNVRVVGIPAGPANEAPVASNDNYNVLEDGSLHVPANGVLGNDTDAEGDTMSASLEADAANGSVELNADGSFDYTPDPDFYGNDSFTYVANDGNGDSNIATVSVTVNPVNDAPVADEQSVAVKQETPKSITLTGSDADGDSLSFSIDSGPSFGNLTGSGANWTYSPNGGFTGLDSFNFVVNDGTINSDVVTVLINVAANNSPLADNQGIGVNEDGSVSITLSGSDPDGDPIMYSLTSGVSHGVLTGLAPNLTYTPDPNFNGPDSFTFKVNDGIDDSADASVSINVMSVNDIPVANPQSVSTAEETPKAITLTGSDIDGDSLTYWIVNQPTHGSLSGSGSTPTYTPETDYVGNDSFTFRVNDGTANSDSVTVSINVTPVNDAPVISSTPVTSATEIHPYTYDVDADDPDGDFLTFTLDSHPAGMTINSSTGLIQWTPTGSQLGNHSVTVSVADGSGGSDSQSFDITVNADTFSPTVVFSDNFENGDLGDQWSQDTQNDWKRATGKKFDGSYAAEIDGRVTNATLISDSIDMSGYGGADLNFAWLIEKGFDTNEFLALDFKNDAGQWVENIRRLDGNVDQENSWHQETVRLEDLQDNYLHNDFQFRFRSTVSSSREDAYVDVVELTANSVALRGAVVDANSQAEAVAMVDLSYLAKWANQSWTTGSGSHHASFELRIADLPGNLLGRTSGNTITIDSNGAGMGWFVDATPWESSEFETKTQMGNQYDLLTVLTHELGHIYGHDHEQAGVMEATLDANTRLLPGKTVDHNMVPMHIDFAFSQWTLSQDRLPSRFGISNGLTSQIEMESEVTKHRQLALPSTDHSYYDEHFQPRIDRKSAVVGSSEDLNAKTDQRAWADLELTDKLFADFDQLLDEFEIELS